MKKILSLVVVLALVSSVMGVVPMLMTDAVETEPTTGTLATGSEQIITEAGFRSVSEEELDETFGGSTAHEGKGVGVPNPAAAYCRQLGYQYDIREDEEGNQYSVCIFPDGSQCDAWSFLKGKCGEAYSYCAKKGYDIETERVDKGSYYTECAVCVSRDGGERISMLELMEENGEPLMDAESYETKGGSGQKECKECEANDMKVSSQDDRLPSAFDWRNVDGHTYIGPIRDQGSCGSCYAFAAAASAEGTYNWATGNYDDNCADFSESFIIWCLGRLPEYNGHFYGCGGADWDYYELEALTVEGICNESDFPYTVNDPGGCTHWDHSRTDFSSWDRVACNDIGAIKTAIMTYGVIDAAVYVGGSFSGYSSGIYSDSSTSCDSSPCYYTYTNHAIALVGWGHDDTYGDYWILRNSWGTDWGEDGYMRIAMTSARVACEATYLVWSTSSPPTVTSVNPNSGQQGETLEVTIGGTDFTGATAVSFGDGITVNSFTVVSATQITANILISATATTGPRDVSVTTPSGTGTLADGFTVVATGQPDITVSPASFDVTLAPDTTQSYTLTIGNDGSADLTYDISDQETAAEGSLATRKAQRLLRSPDLILTNSEYDMSIAVEDLLQIGRYTEATVDAKLLLYGYPYAGSSYMTVRLDGSDYYQDSTMDTYVTQTSTIVDDSIVTEWALPTSVEVSQRLTLQQNTTQYRTTVTNNDGTSHEVKVRFLLDTMLAYNDGAPFIVPGVGNVTTEQEYVNPVFDYWQATDDLVNPTLTSNCTFDSGNKPYKVQFAYWWDIYDVPFDYAITSGQSITWDTAVGMYWDLGTLSPGETKDLIFYYGTADAIIGAPEVSIVTLFTNTDTYLLGEEVTIYVDVGNGGDAALVNGNVKIDVQNPESVSVFEDSSTITVEAGAVVSQNFTCSLSTDAVSGQYTVSAEVYDTEESLLDEATVTFTVGSAYTDCSWLVESPTSGTVGAGSSDSVTVTIDTTGLAEGNYSAEIVIASNDPDEASTTVPVTLQVSPAEPPTIASVSPNSGEQGETLEVAIGGTNFTGATAVSFGDGITVNSFTVVSETQITANISISATATAGSRDVSVTTPDGTGTLAGSFTVVATGLVTVSVDAPDEAAPDSDFTVNVNISEVTNFDACNYDVSFDASVLRLDNVTSGLIGSTTIPVSMYNEISSGMYRVVQNLPGLTGVSGSGCLAVLHFHVIGSEGSSSTIALSNGMLANNLAEEITATWTGDTVNITSVLPGDANGDGTVNALDIIKVERIIAGLDAETPGADANQDGSVNALDIIKVERIIAGLD